jgi:lincosamide nucleotidyltransferase A/C/D/E
MVMEASDVLDVTNALRLAGIDFWLDGGWGVDALLGAQQRPHDDLDIVVPLVTIEQVYDILATLGYRVSEDSLPTRAVLRDEDGHQVDLHPISFDASGNGWQERAMPNGDNCEYPAHDFTTGRLGTATLGCLSAELQLAHHVGYVPRPHDRDDMARLAEHFGLDLPPAYAAQE